MNAPIHLLVAHPPRLAALLALACASACSAPDRIRVSNDGRGFVFARSDAPFTPWGFNYDHDRTGRLLEEYWESEWATVEADFREMRALGATVARVHLQAGTFLEAPDRPRERSLAMLDCLLRVAEETQVRLLLTGLGAYLKELNPPWYDALDDDGRWRAQEVFWRAVAARCAVSPAVFAYDLMNEPVVAGAPRPAGDWLGPPFAERYHFVQFIALDPKGWARADVARDWTRRMASAVRAGDPSALVTVGLVDWSLDRPGLTSGFVPSAIAPEVDFLCVHVYPETGKLDAATETLKGFSVGKPLVVEETFPLRCSFQEFETFLRTSRRHASGWIGFYWGQTPEELKSSSQLADAIVLKWLDLFQALGGEFRDGRTIPASP